MSKRKGSNYERELLEMFHSTGFNGLRAAGSGSSRFPSPDLLVGRNGEVFAIEVKATSKEFVYVSEGQLSELLQFSQNLNATPLICVKFIGKGWRFFNHPRESKSHRFSLVDNGFSMDWFTNKHLNDF